MFKKGDKVVVKKGLIRLVKENLKSTKHEKVTDAMMLTWNTPDEPLDMLEGITNSIGKVYTIASTSNLNETMLLSNGYYYPSWALRKPYKRELGE